MSRIPGSVDSCNRPVPFPFPLPPPHPVSTHSSVWSERDQVKQADTVALTLEQINPPAVELPLSATFNGAAGGNSPSEWAAHPQETREQYQAEVVLMRQQAGEQPKGRLPLPALPALSPSSPFESKGNENEHSSEDDYQKVMDFFM